MQRSGTVLAIFVVDLHLGSGTIQLTLVEIHPIVPEEMSFEVNLFFSSRGHFVQRSGTI